MIIKNILITLASLLLLLLLSELLAAKAAAAATAKPNVVLIFIDDMGYGDIGPFGSTKNRTPNLDRMAKEGMKLTSFYAAPVCSVSRAQVMTGCYGQRVSLPGVLFPGAPTGISSKEHTVAGLMKAQSYATMCIGKWHLGDQPVFLPTRHGFDHYFGLPYSNDMLKKSKVNGVPVVPLVREEKVIELLDDASEDQLTLRYTDEAVKFITDNKARPFFLYLPHTAVHTPIHPGDKFKGRSSNGRYGDWVEEVDWSVGRVLDTLREFGLAENTLVMFSSDNGPWLIRDAGGGSAGPLRGGKGTTWEGGVREPTLAWWPGKIAPGSVCDAIAGNIDFLPTFVRLADGMVPSDNKIDGKDIAPLLLGQTKESPHEARYYYSGYKLQGVRAGPWKIAIAAQYEGYANGAPPVNASLEYPRLYNLDTDIGEQTDVAEKNPDVITRLKTFALKMAAELGDGKPGPEVRKPGRVESPVTLYPTEDGVKKNAPKKSAKATVSASTPGASLENLKIGDTLSGSDAPQIAGKPLTITCEIETQARDGVIVAHGGANIGYTPYIKEGHAIFAVHQPKKDIVRLTSPDVIGAKASIEVRIAADGTMTLALDSKQVASDRIDGPLGKQPAENFCVGHDDKVTVDDYDGKAQFKGAIRDLKISVASSVAH
jgi:arylsulfatase A-like enzyme